LKAVTVMAYPLMRRETAGEMKEVVRSGRSLVAGLSFGSLDRIVPSGLREMPRSAFPTA
jgi:hypothetical protein